MTRIRMAIVALGLIASAGMITACDGFSKNDNKVAPSAAPKKTPPNKPAPTQEDPQAQEVKVDIMAELQKIADQNNSSYCSDQTVNTVLATNNGNRLKTFLNVTADSAAIQWQTTHLLRVTPGKLCKINVVAGLAAETIEQHNVNHTFGDGNATLGHATRVLGVLQEEMKNLEVEKLPTGEVERFEELVKIHTELIKGINTLDNELKNDLLPKLTAEIEACNAVEQCSNLYTEKFEKDLGSLEAEIVEKWNAEHMDLLSQYQISGPGDQALQSKVESLQSIASHAVAMLDSVENVIIKDINTIKLVAQGNLEDAQAIDKEIADQADAMDAIKKAAEQEEIIAAYLELEEKTLAGLNLISSSRNEICEAFVTNTIINSDNKVHINNIKNISSSDSVLAVAIETLSNQSNSLDCQQNVLAEMASIIQDQHNSMASHGDGNKTIDHATRVLALLNIHFEKNQEALKQREDIATRLGALQEGFAILVNEVPLQIEVLKAKNTQLSNSLIDTGAGLTKKSQTAKILIDTNNADIATYETYLASLDKVDQNNEADMSLAVENLNQMMSWLETKNKLSDKYIKMLDEEFEEMFEGI